MWIKVCGRREGCIYLSFDYHILEITNQKVESSFMGELAGKYWNVYHLDCTIQEIYQIFLVYILHNNSG